MEKPGKSQSSGEAGGREVPRDVADTNQLLFKTSSLAMLRAKKGLSPRQSTIENPYMVGAKRVLDFMYNLWLKNRLCDVSITSAEQKVLYAHKLAMGAYSNVLTERFQQQPPGSICHITLTSYNAAVIHSILEFMYTTDLTLNDQIIDPVLGCSLEVGADTIVHMCTDYLSHYNVETALLYHSIAQKYDLVDLERHIYDYICEYFTDISKSHSFLAAHVRVVRALANEDRLNVPTELEVFLAIIKWIDFNRQERINFAASLISCVRMQLITPEVLVTRVEPAEHIFAVPACRNMIYSAIKYHALKLSHSKLAESFPIQTPRCRQDCAIHPPCKEPKYTMVAPPSGPPMPPAAPPTPPVKLQADPPRGLAPPASRYLAAIGGYTATTANQLALVAVGGIDLQSADSVTPGRCVYKLDHSANRWTELAKLSQYTHHHGVVALGGTIYVLGGAVYDPNDPSRLGGATSATFSYTSRTGKWRRLADMTEARAYLTTVAFNGSIFVFGGEDADRKKLDTVERYDIINDRWTRLASMPGGGKIGMSAAVWRDALYVVGGYSRERAGNPVLADVEHYDLQNDRWMFCRPLDVPRCHAGLVTARGRLYLIGGRTKLEGPPQTIMSLSDISVYDDRSDSWTHIADLQVARHDAGCSVVGSKIYIVGGMTTPSPFCLSSVECFDVGTGRWEEHVTDLPYRSSGVGCCTLMSSA